MYRERNLGSDFLFCSAYLELVGQGKFSREGVGSGLQGHRRREGLATGGKSKNYFSDKQRGSTLGHSHSR